MVETGWPRNYVSPHERKVRNSLLEAPLLALPFMITIWALTTKSNDGFFNKEMATYLRCPKLLGLIFSVTTSTSWCSVLTLFTRFLLITTFSLCTTCTVDEVARCVATAAIMVGCGNLQLLRSINIVRAFVDRSSARSPSTMKEK